MSHNGGRGRFNTSTLAVCAGAQRFARRRGGNSCRHDIWRSVFLYWRRKRRWLERVRTGNNVSMRKASWFPQFRLCLNMFQSDQTRGSSSPGSCKAMTRFESWQSVTVHAHHRLQPCSVAYGIRPQARHHVPRHFRCGTEPRQRGIAGISISAGPAKLMIAVPMRARDEGVGHAQGLIFRRAGGNLWVERVLAAKSLHLAKQPAHQKMTVHRETISRWMHTRTLRQLEVNHISTLGCRRGSEAAVRIPSLRPNPEAPLFFRRKAASVLPQEQIVEAFPRSAEWTVTAQVKTTNPSPLTQPVEASSRAGGASIVERATIDPILLNRLTDDVIRRVEQRVRIERERRGL